MLFIPTHAFYLDLHQNPELSSHKTQTAVKLRVAFTVLGVTSPKTLVGRESLLSSRIGPGPTVMLRTELDALPVEEKIGLPYASKVHPKDDSWRDVSVMQDASLDPLCGFPLYQSSGGWY